MICTKKTTDKLHRDLISILNIKPLLLSTRQFSLSVQVTTFHIIFKLCLAYDFNEKMLRPKVRYIFVDKGNHKMSVNTTDCKK